MDVLTLSRLQFAIATYFHFLFVPLTLGLSLLVANAWMQSRSATRSATPATLTAFNSVSSHLTLSIMLGVVAVFVPLVLLYRFWVYRTFSFPISEADLGSPETAY